MATLPGIAFGINLSCFFSGVARTPIAHAEFINALTPLIVVPLAAFTLKERVPRYVLVGGAVALGGVSLILSQAPAAGTSHAGDLLVVGSMLAWVFYLMKSKPARARLGTPEFMRLRVGVGRPGRGDRRDLADYVLADFEPDEDAAAIITRAAEAVETLDIDGLDAAQRQFN